MAAAKFVLFNLSLSWNWLQAENSASFRADFVILSAFIMTRPQGHFRWGQQEIKSVGKYYFACECVSVFGSTVGFKRARRY